MESTRVSMEEMVRGAMEGLARGSMEGLVRGLINFFVPRLKLDSLTINDRSTKAQSWKC